MRPSCAASRRLVIWGTGTPRREFLHVDDCADACVHLMNVYSGDGHVNVGSGEDLTILALAQLVCEVVGFKGEIERDLAKPDGTPRKLMSAAKMLDLGVEALDRATRRPRADLRMVPGQSHVKNTTYTRRPPGELVIGVRRAGLNRGRWPRRCGDLMRLSDVTLLAEMIRLLELVFRRRVVAAKGAQRHCLHKCARRSESL